ncbi:MAG: NFACT family protein [Clostridia bacterium]|nr:NFACT family protein [Clostridia bacterium]
MAFDAGMLAASVFELNKSAVGARVEKINQPSRDEVVLLLRGHDGNIKLMINAGPNNPRMGITSTSPDNPDKPPMFCVILRRHLAGSRLASVSQLDFERAARLKFAAHDEMGFDTTRYLIAEVMGKYSNLILTDGDGKIISALKIVDFATSSKRQVLPGMSYEMPPKQDKLNPTVVTAEEFNSAFDAFPAERSAEKFITSSFLGISATVAREIVFRATRHTDTPCRFCDREILSQEFFAVFNLIKNAEFSPTLVNLDGTPSEYCFMPLRQYGSAELRSYSSVGELLDAYFGERDRAQRNRQRAADLLRVLTNAESRIKRKLDAQRGELADCERGVEFKEKGDLITANICKLSRGDKKVILTDYSIMDENGNYGQTEIELDSRLTPAANAQRYYKKYAKAKTAKIELTRQISLGESELEYLYSVFDSLAHAETAADLAEIRDELSHSGYASRLKTSVKVKKQPKPTVARFITSGGFTVLCGKNNLQNEYITFKLAEKDDWWFHVKGSQGSHVLMVCEGREPGDADFTEAAEIAAHFSRLSGGARVDVDYMKARQVKRVANGKPGLVIYHSNWSCTVSPDAEKIAKMRV